MNNLKTPRSRGIYLLPNLFTTAGIFLGFLAIVMGMKGHFSSSAVAILVAMITDSLDGRIARMTQTQTAFGAEYDSLSDMVVFGLAPSLVLYEQCLMNLGKFGWLVAFLYTACTALRLARFNTQIQTVDKKYFQGLAGTAAAGVIAAWIWLGHGYHLEGQSFDVVSSILMLFVAACMVSNIRYRSFKEIDFTGKVPFMALLLIVLVFMGIAIDPPSVLFLVFFGYACSGPFETLIYLRRVRQVRRKRLKRKQSE